MPGKHGFEVGGVGKHGDASALARRMSLFESTSASFRLGLRRVETSYVVTPWDQLYRCLPGIYGFPWRSRICLNVAMGRTEPSAPFDDSHS